MYAHLHRAGKLGLGGCMRPECKHETLFTEKYRYLVGPFIAAAANGDWLVTWNMSIRREEGRYSPRRYLHPPEDPEYRNYMIRSKDQGKTWGLPRAVPTYEWTGTEHVSLCPLENGELLAAFYQREFFPLEEGKKNQSHRYGWHHNPPYPWIVTHGGTYVFRSKDNGETWDESGSIDASPFISAYSPRPIVQIDDDTLMFTAGAADPMYVNGYWRKPPHTVKNSRGNRIVNGSILEEASRVYICISRDGGHSWRETREIAAHPDYDFLEPTMIRFSSGRLVCHLRNCRQTSYLWQVISDDDGETWSEPAMTPMWGYPAHLVQLSDGRLLSVYGHRREPYGIRACVSRDEGNTWDYDDEIIIRDDLVSASIGYPVSIVLEDDSVATVYWDEDAGGNTSVVLSTYRL